jgi:hypothetical protein
MKEEFLNLSPQLQEIFTTVPMYVSGAQNPDAENDQQAAARQERFLSLPKGIRWKLASFETGEKIQAISQKYGFELLRLANITRLIREYYFGEVPFQNFPTEIERRMGVSLLTAQEITRYIKQEIIDWDPWAEYIASLPKMTAREIIQNHPKIADMEITAGYVELPDSDDLEDPTIKNWTKDYVSHLGYERHSQMERTQYLFHGENGKDLSSQDREKLGIILKSFDENIPLPVDEENNEIVFDGLTEHSPARPSEQKSPSSPPAGKAGSPFKKGGETAQDFPLSQRVIGKNFEKAPVKPEPFIKPYNPTSVPQRNIPKPIAAPVQPKNPILPKPISQTPAPVFSRPAAPAKNPPTEQLIHPNMISQPNKHASAEIDKYFNTPESHIDSQIKIHSITERDQPKVAPQAPLQPTVQQRPVAPQPKPLPRPRHVIINPEFSAPTSEPRLDGNIVDLSEK